MKKLMKKGSLLIVWSLLLAMMFGMSVHAGRSYHVGEVAYGAVDEHLFLQEKQGSTILFDDGDEIIVLPDSVLVIDENAPIVGSGSDTTCVDIRGSYKVISCENLGGGEYRVTLQSVPDPAPAPVDPAPAPGEPAPEKEEDKHEHNWEWIQIQAATDAQDGVEAMCCTECGQQRETRKIANSAYGMFCNATADKISKAAENATVEMGTEIWSALPKSVMDAIKERRDLTVNLTLTYQNKEYPLSIPAGYDMSVLEEADWYGVLYLNQFFGAANQ